MFTSSAAAPKLEERVAQCLAKSAPWLPERSEQVHSQRMRPLAWIEQSQPWEQGFLDSRCLRLVLQQALLPKEPEQAHSWGRYRKYCARCA
jgi:hypothetical protein